MKYQTVQYKDIAVSYSADLDGGGMTFGQTYLDVVRRRIGPVSHAYEFCAGPGFIGFALLAHGLCERLTLSDVNPDAVRACEHTIRENQLEGRVKVYLSDGLDDIPASERWDLVVSNPPHYNGSEKRYREAIRLVDPGFRIHKRFYATVGAHLRPGASILIQENAHASSEADFVPMITESGLRFVEAFSANEDGTLRRAGSSGRLGTMAREMVRRAFWPIERVLMNPAVERIIKDNRAYRALSALPGAAPTYFYFVWSKPIATPEGSVRATNEAQTSER